MRKSDEIQMRRRKCRVWWPNHLSSTIPHSSVFLFGWFVSSSPYSLDIVVAFSCDEASIFSAQSNLQGILHEINGKMPVFLQDKCMLAMLGNCAADLSVNGPLPKLGMVNANHFQSTQGNICCKSGQDGFQKKYGQWSCGCQRLDGLLEKYGQAHNWVQLGYDSLSIINRVHWIPKLHHLHWNGQTISHFDLHVIFYETPRFGSHHFTLGFGSSSEQITPPLKKPKWVEDLHQKRPLLDLDTVIMAINCAIAAKLLFEGHVCPERSTIWLHMVCMFLTFMWQLIAVTVASFSTLFYVILQFFHVLLSHGSQSCIYITSEKVFCNTWKIIQLRCCQMLYWPVPLLDHGHRSRSCVEYAEKAALRKTFIWSSVAVDVLLGNVFGIALLFYAEPASEWVSNFASDITNHLLRTGCVWLMGIPAGFKLNTELAGVLGMLSLNAIQIWCTLWLFVGSYFIYFIRGLALVGILFGLTTPAALVKDMILLATVHVSTLHWLLSFLYSGQIQAIAALWRLFRGRKWNPLRHRLDSYDYSVEQHIVGSLLFTPLLLLLPTTSLFYIFFTIMNTTIIFSCIFIEVTISFIHATPYAKIFLWLVRPRRLPCGIWFEILSCQSNASYTSKTESVDASRSLSEKLHKTIDESGNTLLVSFLRSNFLNLGQLVWPYCRYVYSAVSRASIASSAYGILTGKSIPSALGTSLPSKLPWISIPFKDYWHLCHEAILACKADCRCHLPRYSSKRADKI